MKLNYYLRGLATGLVIATLILTIAHRDNKPLTDAQIRQRAVELGMIDGDSVKLSALQSSASEPSSAAEQSSASEPSSAAEQSSASEPSSAAEQSSASEPSSAAEQSSASEPSSTTEQGAIIISIYGGATSYTVSKDLAAAGLVADAKAYDAYLCDNGYARSIRVGTYEILPGTSEEEIAKMIAR